MPDVATIFCRSTLNKLGEYDVVGALLPNSGQLPNGSAEKSLQSALFHFPEQKE